MRVCCRIHFSTRCGDSAVLPSAFAKKQDTDGLENKIHLHLKHRLTDRSRAEGWRGVSSSLCQHPASAAASRCLRIQYIRYRAVKKRELSDQKPDKIPLIRDPETQPLKPQPAGPAPVKKPITTAATTPARSPTQKPSAIPKHMVGPTAPSQTAPGIPDSAVAKQKFAATQKSSFGAGSVISVPAPINTRYPKPPKIEPTASNAQCPYCCKHFNRADFENKDWWR